MTFDITLVIHGITSGILSFNILCDVYNFAVTVITTTRYKHDINSVRKLYLYKTVDIGGSSMSFVRESSNKQSYQNILMNEKTSK